MNMKWNDKTPIYKQLKDKIIELILDGNLNEGDPLPSVRQVSSEYQINHLTVSKAYHELADEAIVETRRGLGMFINQGIKQKLLESEREKFINQEWPLIVERINRLNIDPKLLLSKSSSAKGKK